MAEKIKPAHGYTEDSIRSLDWKEHIRTRPGMYIGKLGDGTSKDDGIYVLLKEVIDNSIDEFVMGYGKTIEVKISDGNVSKFRKTYKMPFKYNYAKENNYSQDYLDKIYLQAEYYVANTKNESLLQLVKSKTQIEYSIEQQTRDGKEYTVLGIGNVFEHRVQTAKWLYIGNDYPQKLYEYDLPNDKLIEFK